MNASADDRAPRERLRYGKMDVKTALSKTRPSVHAKSTNELSEINKT